MSATYFLFWLKGYLAALESNDEMPCKDDLDLIKLALEQAIKAELPANKTTQY